MFKFQVFCSLQSVFLSANNALLKEINNNLMKASTENTGDIVNSEEHVNSIPTDFNYDFSSSQDQMDVDIDFEEEKSDDGDNERLNFKKCEYIYNKFLGATKEQAYYLWASMASKVSFIFWLSNCNQNVNSFSAVRRDLKELTHDILANFDVFMFSLSQ